MKEGMSQIFIQDFPRDLHASSPHVFLRRLLLWKSFHSCHTLDLNGFCWRAISAGPGCWNFSCRWHRKTCCLMDYALVLCGSASSLYYWKSYHNHCRYKWYLCQLGVLNWNPFLVFFFLFFSQMLIKMKSLTCSRLH